MTIHKLFNIRTQIKATWSPADPNRLESVVIITDYESKSEIWNTPSNSRFNFKAFQYHRDGGETFITLYPSRGYESRGKLIASMAFLAVIMAQVEDLDLLLDNQLSQEDLTVKDYPTISGFELDPETIDELKKLWVGIKAVINLENMIQDIKLRGLVIGDLKQWQYEANEALRRLKFSDRRDRSDIASVEARVQKITDTFDSVKRRNELQGINLSRLEASLESFADSVAENGLNPALVAQYKNLARDIEAEASRLDDEAREFGLYFSFAKTALQEIRAATPPAPPAPIVKNNK